MSELEDKIKRIDKQRRIALATLSGVFVVVFLAYAYHYGSKHDYIGVMFGCGGALYVAWRGIESWRNKK